MFKVTVKNGKTWTTVGVGNFYACTRFAVLYSHLYKDMRVVPA